MKITRDVVTDLLQIRFRDVDDVLAAIAVLRERDALTEELLRTRADGNREVLDLLAT